MPRADPPGFSGCKAESTSRCRAIVLSKPILRPDEQPAAFIAFDSTRATTTTTCGRCRSSNAARCSRRLFAKHKPPSSAIRLSEQVAGDGRALLKRARDEGWEGLLVKHARSVYRDGRRSPEWRKLKIQHQDEFVIGGWTEPKGGRVPVSGRSSSAITIKPERWSTRAMSEPAFRGPSWTGCGNCSQPLEDATSPFQVKPKTLGRPHWAKPKLVAQVRYTEWTDDGRLRHPVYLGLRDDKVAKEVTKNTKDAKDTKDTKARSSPNPLKAWAKQADAMTAQLDDLERRKKDGKLQLPDGDTLDVTNLQKVFWPGPKYTKGDLLRYYARIAPLILPVIDDRPLVMKRFPNGVEGQAFYQHRAPDVFPKGVRVERIPDADVPTMFVGGDLKTLLYMAQLAAISMDPWFSKVGTLDEPDVVAIDLDPQPGATFTQILDVARWVRDELERLEVPAFPKTSGSEGLHMFIPLPKGTSYEAGMLFCQIVATIVASKHPKVATIERMVKRRKDRTIYVDYLQNIPGKTLACAYSARASAFAGVSAPLTWDEIDKRSRRRTSRSRPSRPGWQGRGPVGGAAEGKPRGPDDRARETATAKTRTAIRRSPGA